MAGTTGNMPLSRLLGAELRLQRTERFDGSLRAFAKAIGYSHSMVSKWENGEILPTPEQVAVIAGVLGIVGEDRDRLIGSAKNARDPDWVIPGVDRQVAAIRAFDDSACRATFVSPQIPAGILQTRATAEAIVSRANLDKEQQNAIVDARMSRKEALLRPKPLALRVFLGIRVVTRKLGGVDVAIDQLRYLLKMGELPHVTVQVIEDTDDFTPADMGPFVAYEFEFGDPIVYFEHHRSSSFAPRKDVQDMLEAVKRIEEVAMSPAQTAGLIANVITRWETT